MLEQISTIPDRRQTENNVNINIIATPITTIPIDEKKIEADSQLRNDNRKLKEELAQAYVNLVTLRRDNQFKQVEIDTLTKINEASDWRIKIQEEKFCNSITEGACKKLIGQYRSRQEVRVNAMKKLEAEFPILSKLTRQQFLTLYNDAFTAPLLLEDVDQCPHKVTRQGPCDTIHTRAVPESYNPGVPMPDKCPALTRILGCKYL
jgi:hypothetical protein